MKKKNSQKQMFFEIWNEREHVCTNCKRHLGNEPLAQYFSHIKPKGLYPELKFDKDNIQLLCFECHYAFDFQGEDKYQLKHRR
jgi:5-methylcytosine-specific restriction endonuclease McrA|tara:strand:+ start:122 stop:370 length:249 start_codon:yes stop_codon:yes gene_type:complete